MESRVKLLPLMLDIRSMGGLFYIPILSMGLSAVYCMLQYSGLDDRYLLPQLRHAMGVLSIPMVCIWIIAMFQDYTATEGKETILALPYPPVRSGMLRVWRMTVLYALLFMILYVVMAAGLSSAQITVILEDLYVPIISIFLFAGLSFLLIVIFKNPISCYILAGGYALFHYMTRGAYSLGIYPFQWSLPQPYMDSMLCSYMMLAASGVLFTVAQSLFANREFMMR